MTSEHMKIKMRLENARAREVKERAELVKRIEEIDRVMKLTDTLLECLTKHEVTP